MLQSSFHQGSALRRFRNSRVSREDVEALADDASDLLGKLVSFGGGEIGGDHIGLRTCFAYSGSVPSSRWRRRPSLAHIEACGGRLGMPTDPSMTRSTSIYLMRAFRPPLIGRERLPGLSVAFVRSIAS